jgi:hypothetical protein
MLKKIILSTILILVSLFLYKKCSVDYQSRERHKWTKKICDNLYTETFCVFGQGAFGGDLDSRWLTDSTNFRIYLGTFDEVEGGIYVECSGDIVFVTQKPDNISGIPKDKSVTAFYKISDLKKKQNLNQY